LSSPPTRPTLSAAPRSTSFDVIQENFPRDPDHTELDYGHGRIIRRSLWVTDAGSTDFPHVKRVAASAATSTAPSSPRRSSTPSPASQGSRGQWGIESVHWVRDTAYAEDASTGYAGNGPQVMATLRNLAISLLYLSGVTEITRTPPGHHARPKPHTRLPAAMRHSSQTTLAIP
jgi:hypothetical protein